MKFNFRPEMKGFVGVERERFLSDKNGVLVPRAEEFLWLVKDKRWTYELSACQVEDRTNPRKSLRGISNELAENDKIGKSVARKMGLSLVGMEVAPYDIPLDVYPDARYLSIVKNISKEQLRAACRVAGTHLHFGVTNLEHAIYINNILTDYLWNFCLMGDHSGFERLDLYKTMARDWKPVKYENVEHFFETAVEQGFSENPRNCWHLIRISVHGTVELRMFGVAEKLEEVIDWVYFVRKISRGVL